MPAIIYIRSKELGFSKYLLYIILMSCLCYPFFTRVWHALTYTQIPAVIDAFTFSENYTSRKNTSYYPVAIYRVNDNTYSCTGSSLQRDELHVHDSVTVLYNPADPEDAFVYSFLGYWAPKLTYILPLGLLLSLMFFGLDRIPKMIRIKL